MSGAERRALVCGAGFMGHGIAQVLAAAGWEVRLYEPALARAVAGRDRVAANLDRALAKGRIDAATRDAILGRILPVAELPAAVAGAGLVVEAIVEDEAAKRALFAALSLIHI